MRKNNVKSRDIKTPVLYKLIYKDGNLTVPEGITDSQVYEQSKYDIKQTVFSGYITLTGASLPEGVLSVITEDNLASQQETNLNSSLKKRKQRLYAQNCDPLFMEAFREHMLGRDEKWNIYLANCRDVYDITE